MFVQQKQLVMKEKYFSYVAPTFGFTHYYKQSTNGILHINLSTQTINITNILPGEAELCSKEAFDAARVKVTEAFNKI